MQLERLKNLTASTLALYTRAPSREAPEVVLVHESQAGVFMLGASVAYERRAEEKLWLTGNGVRLRGLSALVTFTTYGDIARPAYDPCKAPTLTTHSVDRSDGRAPTNAQWSKVVELAREAYQLMLRDVPALWAAVDWVLAEARVKAIVESVAALEAERLSLGEKLKGARPW